MTARLVALAVWAAAAASAVFWGYRIFVKPLPVPSEAAVAEAGGAPVGGDLTRLFGAPSPVAAAADEPVPPADARFKLVGVVAPTRAQGSGLALISVDGKAPRAVGIGGTVEGDLALVAVSHRRVELRKRSGGPSMALELPMVAEAARGTLGDGRAAAVPPAAPVRPPIPSPLAGTQRQAVRPGLPGAGLPGAPPVLPAPGTGQQPAPPAAVQQQPAPGSVPQPAPFGVIPPSTPPGVLPQSSQPAAPAHSHTGPST